MIIYSIQYRNKIVQAVSNSDNLWEHCDFYGRLVVVKDEIPCRIRNQRAVPRGCGVQAKLSLCCLIKDQGIQHVREVFQIKYLVSALKCKTDVRLKCRVQELIRFALFYYVYWNLILRDELYLFCCIISTIIVISYFLWNDAFVLFGKLSKTITIMVYYNQLSMKE